MVSNPELVRLPRLGSSTTGRSIRTRLGARVELPLFLPVYQPRSEAFQLTTRDSRLRIEGLIVNAYFLYKQREIRERLTGGESLSAFIGFEGLIATDSGAFQGFTRQLYLSNRDIVRFQEAIGSDVISPLDLVTPPGDNRSVAQAKLLATNKRIREALRIVEDGRVAGVQQGGRFLDLRRQSNDALVEMGVEYVAIGSLVPFFNRNHDLRFAGTVIRDARAAIGDGPPMHIYGAGDPLELPFFFALGADIFDSASYAHYAKGGHYMTPLGATREPERLRSEGWRCGCPICADSPLPAVMSDELLLTQHNLWTIHEVIHLLRRLAADPAGFDRYLAETLDSHRRLFPDSLLPQSWESLF
ncbi:MAG TPA: tRNA-guanine transglycosylase [Allosphingosinicella sp.]|jgi:7-cyano-7-deazaguanine tRNA-ribosyltransferase|nr:tRNA-guanine transglycosylase [Allosphingosinicella sp.]